MHDAATIYADYQATTPVDPRVVTKMVPYWGESFGNSHSSDHVIGWQADKAVREAASSIAALIGADLDEIIFTSGATEANNLALLGLARRAPDGRRRILVSAIEHKCVLAAARALSAREGFTAETIPVDGEGLIDLNALERCLDGSVLVVSVMAVNNEVGTIQDIPRIAEMLAPQGVPLHCDAAQAPCAMDVSNLAVQADLVSLSGHKMYGPQVPPARPAYPNLPTCFAPWVLPRHRAMRPSASALAGSRPTTRSKDLLIWFSRLWIRSLPYRSPSTDGGGGAPSVRFLNWFRLLNGLLSNRSPEWGRSNHLNLESSGVMFLVVLPDF